VKAQVPDPVTGEPRRRELIIYRRDDGNESIVLSTYDDAAHRLCTETPTTCQQVNDALT
jgi:hypothetical protein